MVTLAEFKMSLDSAGQAVAHEPKIHEAGAHCHFLGTERVAEVPRFLLLGIVDKRSPLDVDGFSVDGLFDLGHLRFLLRRLLDAIVLSKVDLGGARGDICLVFEHLGWMLDGFEHEWAPW